MTDRVDADTLEVESAARIKSKLGVGAHGSYASADAWSVAPRPGTFRVLLSLALLAWTSLSFGALARALLVADATAPSSPMQAMSSHAAVAQGGGTPIAHAASNPGQAPVMPMGQGDCCHGGCHCLFACNAALAVPRFSIVTFLAPPPLLRLATTRRLSALAAPPLRPPIA